MKTLSLAVKNKDWEIGSFVWVFWTRWKWGKTHCCRLFTVGKQQFGWLFPSDLVWIPGNLIFASCDRGEQSRDANRMRRRERGRKAWCPQDWILTSLRTTVFFRKMKPSALIYHLSGIERPAMAAEEQKERHIYVCIYIICELIMSLLYKWIYWAAA